MISERFPFFFDDEEEVVSERHLVACYENGELMDSPNSVRFIVIHCSATKCNKDYTEKQMLRDHKARGFRTIGYHFYCRKDGTVSQHRKLLEVGAHARPYNRCSIGICYEGGLDEDGRPHDTLTDAQFSAIKHLLVELKIMFPKAQIVGHRDLPGASPKECPCFDAASKFKL